MPGLLYFDSRVDFKSPNQVLSVGGAIVESVKTRFFSSGLLNSTASLPWPTFPVQSTGVCLSEWTSSSSVVHFPKVAVPRCSYVQETAHMLLLHTFPEYSGENGNNSEDTRGPNF